MYPWDTNPGKHEQVGHRLARGWLRRSLINSFYAAYRVQRTVLVESALEAKQQGRNRSVMQQT